MKKLLALFLTLALLLSVLPMALGASAAEATGTGDYAIYFDSSISNNFWVTQKDSSHLEIGMEEPNLPAGNTYTVEFDVYSLTLGSRVVFGATNATWSTTTAIENGHQVWKEAPTSVNTWTHYSFNVTTTAEWKGVMFYVIDDADGFTGYIDNLTIKDSQGTVVSSFEPTADDISNISNCASIVELSAELVYAKNPDYAIYFDNTTSNSFWLTGLGMASPNLPADNSYTVEMDVYALTQGANIVFNGVQGHFNTDHAIPGGQVWKDAPTELNKWVTLKYDITTTATLGGVYLHILGDAGFKGYVDNFKIKDSTGAVIFEFEPNDTTKTSNGASIVVLSRELAYAKNPDYAIYIDNSANDIQSNKIWFNELSAPKMSLEPGKTYTLKFDNYALNSSFKGHCYEGIHGTGGGITGQNWWDTVDRVNGWATQTVNFTPSGDQALAYHTLYVGAGFKGYLDNFRVYDGETEVARLEFDSSNLGKTSASGTATVVLVPQEVFAQKAGCIHTYAISNITYPDCDDDGVKSYTCSACGDIVDIKFADKTGHSYDNVCDAECNVCSEVREAAAHVDANGDNVCDVCAHGDYAIYFDNTGTDSTFWVNALGMEAPNLPAGNTYTVEFDAYALTQGNNFVFNGTQGLFNTSHAIPGGQVWQGAPATLNEWTHYSFNITTEATLGGIYFHTLGDGFKGYMDNLTIKDSNGNVVASFNPTSANTSSTSNGASIVALSKELEYAKNPDYAIYIDNSASDIQSNKIWFNELSAPKMSLEPGKTYTLKFDNYALNSSFKGHCYEGIHGTGGGITGQNWWDTVDRVNGWATQTVNFTPSGDQALAYHTLYVGAGFKGYLDNFRVYDGETEVARLEFDSSNLGKTSASGTATVVLVPQEVFAQKAGCIHTYAISNITYPDCDDDGVKSYTCSACGDIVDIKFADKTGHSYDNACDTNCNVCDEVREVEGHVYENYVSNNDATCTANGTETGTCACGATDTREVADSKLDHVYENYVSNNDATCTANGTETGTCACGATDTREVADSKLDHVYENYVSNNDATCTANGTETGTCVCGDTHTREVADSKLDHVYENYVSNNDATCTANGTETGTCVCGDTHTREVADSKLDHVYENYVSNNDATCTANGTETGTCVCGDTHTREVADSMIDHYYRDEFDAFCDGCDAIREINYPADKVELKEIDGVKYIYVNGRTSVEGLFKVGNDYYYATWGGVVLTGDQYVHLSYCDKAAGKHLFFAEDGKMVVKGFATVDGVKKLYIDGRTSVEGLFEVDGKYYLATWGGVVLTDGRYYVTESFVEGEDAGKEFTVDAEGAVLDGIVEIEGAKYLYDLGTTVVPGEYEIGGQTVVATWGGLIVE